MITTACRLSFVSVALLTLASSAAAQWWIPIREIAKPDLDDVAFAAYDNLGPVIYYNPAQLALMGEDAARFVRAHEYAHHFLGHGPRKARSHPFTHKWLQADLEREADCFAATRLSMDGDKDAIDGFLHFLRSANRPARGPYLSDRDREQQEG